MKLERTLITRCTAEEADAASGWQGWADRSPTERSIALESMRALRISHLSDGSLPRLQRVLTVVKRGER